MAAVEPGVKKKKVALLGATGTGKTTFAMQLKREKFAKLQPTPGMHIYELESRSIYDMGGAESLKFLRWDYTPKDVDTIYIFYNKASRDSIEKAKQICEEARKNRPDAAISLIATKHKNAEVPTDAKEAERALSAETMLPTAAELIIQDDGHYQNFDAVLNGLTEPTDSATKRLQASIQAYSVRVKLPKANTFLNTSFLPELKSLVANFVSKNLPLPGLIEHPSKEEKQIRLMQAFASYLNAPDDKSKLNAMTHYLTAAGTPRDSRRGDIFGKTKTYETFLATVTASDDIGLQTMVKQASVILAMQAAIKVAEKKGTSAEKVEALQTALRAYQLSPGDEHLNEISEAIKASSSPPGMGFFQRRDTVIEDAFMAALSHEAKASLQSPRDRDTPHI